MHSNNNELVKAGHDLAAELNASCGAVNLRDVAKLITALTTQLDVTTAALRAMQSERDQLAAQLADVVAENALLNVKMDKLATWPGIEFYSSSWEFNNGDGNEALEFMCDTQTPATDRFLAEQQSIGIQKAASSGLFSNWVNQSLISFAITVRNGDDFAAQLRNGGKV